MTIYMDVIWLLNFLFDSLLLFLTTIFLKKKVNMYKVFIAAAIGASYLLLTIGEWAILFSHPMMKIIISIIMIVLVFGYHKLSIFLKHILTFYLATFVTGGSLFGLHYLFSFKGTSYQFGDPVSWIFILIATPIAIYFSRKTIKEITYSNIQTNALYEVKVAVNDLCFDLIGLVDSGNQLHDPVSREPVMIVQLSSVREQLPNELVKMLERPGANEMIADLPIEWTRIMRLIPVKVLGVDQQLLYGFKIQSIQINGKLTQGIIIFTDQQLSSEAKFNCIVHPEMIVNGESLSVS